MALWRDEETGIRRYRPIYWGGVISLQLKQVFIGILI